MGTPLGHSLFRADRRSLSCPDLITQRGNRRQQTFFCEEVYRAYKDLVEDWSGFLARETATEHVQLLRLHENRQTARQRRVHRSSGEDGWPKAEAKKARAKEDNRKQLSVVYTRNCQSGIPSMPPHRLDGSGKA